MASRIIAQNKVIAASKGREWPSAIPEESVNPEEFEDRAVVHYAHPPSRDVVIDRRYGVRFRVIDKLDASSGWMDTATITQWLHVSYARLMDLVVAGIIDCAVERGSPVRAFRVLRHEDAMNLRAKALKK